MIVNLKGIECLLDNPSPDKLQIKPNLTEQCLPFHFCLLVFKQFAHRSSLDQITVLESHLFLCLLFKSIFKVPIINRHSHDVTI